jgi:glycosyltransferase involved in cell wall biosynthesis
MKIHHFEFPKLGHGVSGGEQCLVEVIRNLKSRGVQNILYTTDNGRETYERLGLMADPHLEYVTINSYAVEQKRHVFISFLSRTVQAVKLIKSVRLDDDDVLLCNSDAFPNSIPFFILARKNPSVGLIYWFRMRAPDLFKGFEGHFTGKRQLPTAAVVQFKLAQWLYCKLVLRRGVVLTHNPHYRSFLERVFPHNRIHILAKYGGGTAGTKPRPASEKRYDLVWIGRFHVQKGVFEIIDILKRLKREKPDTSIAIIGGDDGTGRQDFENRCKQDDLTSLVTFMGHKTGEEKFEILRQARVFLMTSYYESYGIVIVEALDSGLPVVAYDLPVYGVFENGVIKVGILDNEAAKNAILRLLRDHAYYEEKAQEAQLAGDAHSWERVSDEILSLCTTSAMPNR